MEIHIPTPLRGYTGGKATVMVEAKTVQEGLTALVGAHAEIKKHLYTEEGKLRAFVNLYLNDEDVRYLPAKEETAVGESDSLTIIPSIAGGCSRGGSWETPSEDCHPERSEGSAVRLGDGYAWRRGVETADPSLSLRMTPLRTRA